MATVTQFPSSGVFVIEKGISQLFCDPGLKMTRKLYSRMAAFSKIQQIVRELTRASDHLYKPG